MTVLDSPPLVDVLVVSYDACALLHDCLTSIERHRPRATDAMVQVSVFDNASSDGSADMIAECFPQARLIRSNTNVGFGAANNVLAKTSTADYLMLLNSDTAFVVDIVTPLLGALNSDPQIALVAPRLEYPDGRPQFSSEGFPTLRFEVANALHGTKLWAALRRPCSLDRALAQTRRTDHIECRQTHDADFVWATCWLLRRCDVAADGLFDERFFVYDEDLDYCKRLRLRGGGRRIVWIGSSTLVHHGGASSTTDAKERLARSSRRLYYRRHAGPVEALTYTGIVSAVGAVKALTDRIRQWKVWELDGELRYKPVVAALPEVDLPICEVGSGPQGLAAWTDRDVVGVDPGSDLRHGIPATAANLRRVAGDGANIPLPDRSVAAAVAVDTFEHIPRDSRAAVVAEMKRVVVSGGRVIIIGPTGEAAGAADAKVLARWRASGDQAGVAEWLSEHELYGLPSVEELVAYIGGDRVRAITVVGVFNVRLWWLMHRALLGDFSRSRPSFLLRQLLTHPFGALARRWRRGPFYRYLVVTEIS